MRIATCVVLCRCASCLAIDLYAFLGAGEDHLDFVVNGDWIFYFAWDMAASQETTRDEANLLIFLQPHSPLPIPLSAYRDAAHNCIDYKKLAGLADVPAVYRGLLSALHAAPLDLAEAFVHEDPVALADWLAEARATFGEVQAHIPLSLWPRIAAFLSAPVPAGQYMPTFAHNDLGIEHILVDLAARRITGIIDWGDAAIADPACDFGKLYRDLGLATLEAALAHYRPTANDLDAMRERATFYGRCTMFEDLAYGLRNGHEAYLRKSLALLDQLFD